MPRLTAPLLSGSARGKFADALVFQKRPSGHTVYPLTKPRFRQVPSQIYQRWMFADAIVHWQALSAGVKADWNDKARSLGISGYNHYCHYYLTTLPEVVGWWHLDEASGSALIDSGKKGLDGTNYGAERVAGPIGNCLKFDGIDDYATVPAAVSSHISTTITIAVSVYLDEKDTFHALYWDFPDAPNKSIGLFIWDSNRLEVGVSMDGTASQSGVSTFFADTGQWYRIVFVFQGPSGAFWVNGVNYGYPFLSYSTLYDNQLVKRVGSRVAWLSEIRIEDLLVVNEVWGQVQVERDWKKWARFLN